MQITEKRNFMDIFYINCFSHSLYLSRARNISCFSCFLTIVYAIYSRNRIYLGETTKQKHRVIRKRQKKESGAECRGDAKTTEFIHCDSFSGGSYNFLLFVLKKHMLGFAQIISVFRTWWRFARVGVRYPVSGTCSRSSFCKWRTGACLF